MLIKVIIYLWNTFTTSKGCRKKDGRKKATGIWKKKIPLEADLPINSYDRDRPFFRYSWVLETISLTLHSSLSLAIQTTVETDQEIKNSLKL